MDELSAVWQFLSMFGDIQYWLGFAIGSLIIYIILDKKNKKRMSWFIFSLLPAILFSYQLSYVLKLWFAIPRPCTGLAYCPTDFSFPSGHAAVIFAFATIGVLNIKRKWLRASIVLLACLVSVSRIFLIYHTNIDVLAGAAIGVFCAYLIQTAYKTFPQLK